ncbi:MAG: cysteine desulfurase family protein [Bacteroidetes bacterium]|nr:cysteine desulfurase family protein [Bacteroidota bacterium]
MHVYFDNAATTPMAPEVIEVMTTMMTKLHGNPSSIHKDGREVKTEIEKARKLVASILNCSPGEIVFTSGGTEADNMALRCSVDALNITHAITSPIEHHAVLHTLEELQQRGEIKLTMVNILKNGHIDLVHLEEILAGNPGSLVSLMHANNEIGNLLDIDKVSALCGQYNAIFHSDTVQTIGHYPIDLKKTKIHFLTCAAHKLNGPKGVGFIYINSNVRINPFITGGTQERNMRGGTENVYGIVGLAKALEIASNEMPLQTKYITSLRTYMMEQLRLNFPEVCFNGDADGQSSYLVLNVCFPPSPVNEMMLFKLDIEGVSASGGSACSSGSNIGSHVLTALEVPDACSNVRFSFGKYNTREEIDFVIQKLKEMLHAL